MNHLGFYVRTTATETTEVSHEAPDFHHTTRGTLGTKYSRSPSLILHKVVQSEDLSSVVSTQGLDTLTVLVDFSKFLRPKVRTPVGTSRDPPTLPT